MSVPIYDDAVGSASESTVRIVVVDDHRTFADMLCSVLSHQPGLTCVATAHDAANAELLCAAERPDVVVLDVDLPDTDGITLAGRLTAQYPQLRVVIVSAHVTPQTISRATECGACAFVPKNGSLNDILSAIRFSRIGTMSAPPSLLLTIAAADTDSAVTDLAGLTPREHEVLRLLGDGLSVQQISSQLSLSVHTTRGYVKSILNKLEAHSQLEAVLIASRRGIITAA